jgi:hypothetical protein
VAIGLLEIACAIIHLIPRTAVLGAILLAAYLGGAAAVTVEMVDAGGVWRVALGALWLREPRVRALIP